MILRDLAKALHGNINGKWINIRGPDHRSMDRSLGVLFDQHAPDGFWLNSFAGDDPTECREHVKALLQKASSGGSPIIGVNTKGGDEFALQARINAALNIWSQAVPAKDTIVETYLASRGCKLPWSIISADVLRFNPLCPFGGDRVPAMLALMRDLSTGKPKGILITALQDDGSSKRSTLDGMYPRKMRGSSKRAAVMLQDACPIMGIAEGIETALSAHQIFNMPVWAAMSKDGIADFPTISNVKHLTIFADHDKPGLDAACECGRRYAKARIEVEVRYPPKAKTDWNDYLCLEM